MIFIHFAVAAPKVSVREIPREDISRLAVTMDATSLFSRERRQVRQRLVHSWLSIVDYRLLLRGRGRDFVSQSAFPLCAAFGVLQRKSSQPAPVAIGTALEDLREKVPNLGSFGRKSSKPWKFRTKKFQTFEISDEKLPNIESFGRKTSKPRKF